MISTTFETRVRYAETDQMRVAHHSRYFEWFECGRTEMMRQLGYPYRQLELDGYMLPIIEVGCRYIQPATYDDRIQIITEMKQMPRIRIKLEYKILRLPDRSLLGEGFTIHAFMNREGKPVKPNRKFLELMKPYFQQEE